MQGRTEREPKPSKWAAALAILFAILMVAGLVARFWSVHREHAVIGPTQITAGAAGVFVHVSGDILELTASGDLLAVHGADVTGLTDVPIDLRLLTTGEILVATQQPAIVRSCVPDTWTCRTVGSSALSAIERQFKLLTTDDSLLFTDARGDALWRLDGNVLAEALPRKRLAGPNGLARDGSGHVWVADTDHRRIVELLPMDDGTYATGREHSAMNAITVGERHYPMTLEVAADGRLWVAQASDFSSAQADLVVYDPDGGAEAVVPLGEGAYPTDVAILGADVLVTDMERFRIDRVQTSTRLVSPFGGSDLAAQLQRYRAERASFARMATWSMIMVLAAAASMILAALKATPRNRRWTQAPGIDPARAAVAVPDTKGIHWLTPNQKMRWLVNWLDRVYYVLFGLLCLCALLIYAWACRQPWWPEGAGLPPSDRLGIALLLTCLAAAAFIPMIHRSACILRRRIGTDGRRVHFELEDGRRISCAPAELLYNKRALLYRQYAFPLHSGKSYTLYAPGEVDTWLVPLLRPSTRLTEWQTMRHQWKHRDPLLFSVLGAIAFMALILVPIRFLF